MTRHDSLYITEIVSSEDEFEDGSRDSEKKKNFCLRFLFKLFTQKFYKGSRGVWHKCANLICFFA